MEIVIQLTALQQAIIWNGSIITAVMFCFYLQSKEGKKFGLRPVSWLLFLSFVYIAFLLGARMGAWSWADWQDLIHLQELPPGRGRTIQGGLLLALPVILALSYLIKLPLRGLDVFFLPLPLSAAIGRIGCFFSGCCFGRMTNQAWGIQYEAGTPAYGWQLESGLISSEAIQSAFVHPTPLYFFILNSVLFLIVWRLRHKITKPGNLAFIILGGLYFNRFFIEFSREAITNRGVLGEYIYGLKWAQWLCLAIILLSLLLFFINRKRSHQDSTTRMWDPSIEMVGLHLSFIICVGLFLNNTLSFLEEMIIALISLPVLFIFVSKVTDFLKLSLWWKGPVTLTAAVIVIIAMPMDTLIPLKKDTQWLEIGAGTSLGRYDDIERNCDGDIIDRTKLKKSAGSLDVNYNWGLEDGKMGVGFRGTMGSITTKRYFDPQNSRPDIHDFWGSGIYGMMDGPKWGIHWGVLFVKRKYDFEDQHNFSNNKIIPFGHVRFGRLSKFYVDLSLYDRHSFAFYPQPVGSLGLNYGFKDASGANYFRASFMSLNEEFAFGLNGRFAINNYPIMLEGAMFYQKDVIFNIGLRYRMYTVR